MRTHVDGVNAIKDALKQWVDAMNTRRADIVTDLVSDDVVFIHPPAVLFGGKAAIARLYREAFRAYDVQERLQYEDIRVVGTLATARVTEHIQLKPRAGGAVVGFTEADTMRFRRQSDGAWKLVSRSLAGPSPLLSRFAHLARKSPTPSRSTGKPIDGDHTRFAENLRSASVKPATIPTTA